MEKYKPIIDDWEAFKKQAENHPLQGIRRNPLKARTDFREKLSESFEFENSRWNKDVFRVNSELPGKTMLHWRGEYYVQEESAALPVEVLDPRPGEKVLDMCAAPGGKTTQIAANMQNEGLVVANDSSFQRMKSLHANVYRTGSKIVEATNYDARSIPEDEKFDRILVDAPCSGEGDRYYRKFEAAEEKESLDLSKLQTQIMEKAANLLKPGGTIVYSTCTVSPQENEAVVSKILENAGLELERIETDAEHQRGVEKFWDESFGKEMQKAVRVYPHHLNSGVIFVAKFVKPGKTSKVNEQDVQSSSRNRSEKYMEERFGVSGINLEKINGDYWLCSRETSELEKETRGIRGVRDMKIGLKPTTYLFQLLDDRIEENIVDLNREELENFGEDGMIQRELNKNGYVALKFRGRVIGCGFYKDGLVSNRIPEGRLEELLQSLSS